MSSSAEKGEASVSPSAYKKLERLCITHDKIIRTQAKQLQELTRQLNNLQSRLTVLQSMVNRG